MAKKKQNYRATELELQEKRHSQQEKISEEKLQIVAQNGTGVYEVYLLARLLNHFYGKRHCEPMENKFSSACTALRMLKLHALHCTTRAHCTTLCTARALLCTHTGASYESYTYRILYAQYNRAITGPGALFERGLYCLVRANGWTSIREGLLFEGGFYSRVYGTLK